MSSPVLHLVAGPNGAGKSTLVFEVLQPVTRLPFVNADVIAAQRWPEAQAEHAYEASNEAAQERRRLMDARSSLITETVFSHPSKLDLVAWATGHGYLVHLHVVMVPETLVVARVASRVAHGGHDVPEQKVLERYHRLWPLLVAAREVAARTTFYDNTRAAAPFRVVARYERGRLVGLPEWPRWTPVDLLG